MGKVLNALREARGELPELVLQSLIEQAESARPEPAAAESAPILQVPAPRVHVPEAPLNPWTAKTSRTVSLRVSDSAPLLSADSEDRFAAEQYRVLRANVLRHPSSPSMIVVSSPGSGDGKTVTSVNLAGTLALKGEDRIVLVDADLRRSSVHERLGLPRGPGLAEVLAGTCSLESALLEVEELPNLSILTAGEPSANPSELLDSSAWVALTARLRQQFRRIVIDSPPVQPLADYDLIAAAADGILIVLRPDHTDRRLCKTTLNKVKQKLLGVWLNDAADWFLWNQYTASSDYYRAPEQWKKETKR